MCSRRKIDHSINYSPPLLIHHNLPIILIESHMELTNLISLVLAILHLGPPNGLIRRLADQHFTISLASIRITLLQNREIVPADSLRGYINTLDEIRHFVKRLAEKRRAPVGRDLSVAPDPFARVGGQVVVSVYKP